MTLMQGERQVGSGDLRGLVSKWRQESTYLIGRSRYENAPEQATLTTQAKQLSDCADGLERVIDQAGKRG